MGHLSRWQKVPLLLKLQRFAPTVASNFARLPAAAAAQGTASKPTMLKDENLKTHSHQVAFFRILTFEFLTIAQPFLIKRFSN